MPSIAPVPVARPFVPPEAAAPFYGATAVANGDDLVLANRPGALHQFIEVAPSAAVSALASISDGAFAGQSVTFVNSHAANVFRVPAALGNVGAVLDVDIVADQPETLVWNGSLWYVG